MINLSEVNQINNDLIQEFKLIQGDQLYECNLNNKMIGYAIIRKSINNKIFLALATQYQNQGYGSIIFKLLLSKMSAPVKCFVPIDNDKMRRIVQKNGGIEIGRNGKEIQYIIENI